jgi:uncharacterized protein YjbI with pentapeptide repeats
MVEETKRRTRSGHRRDPPPPPGQTQPLPTAPSFAGKAKDLQALRDAVVDAAGVGAGLWLSYLFVLFYLAIAVGGVTQADLLFENPVKLPFLNVDLPLIGFFVLGPGLFLIVHAYVLLHFVLLAGKIGAFHAELRAQIVDDVTRTSLRRQLPNNIFVQLLAGPSEVRTGIVGFMLRLIAWITLVFGPLTLLVFFQFQFLPYHHEPITWWQRMAVVVDLALLWALWPSIARGEMTRIGDFRLGTVAATAAASLAPIALVFSVATFPGEWLDASLPSVRFVPTSWPSARSKSTSEFVTSIKWTSLHEQLVAGNVDLVARKPTSLWSNRLVVPGIDLMDRTKFDTEAKISTFPETISLRGRRLEGAVFIGARLRKADFTAARLQGARFDYADLRETKFECMRPTLEIPPIESLDALQRCTQLQGASLIGARLQGASFVEAQLQGASFNDAQLQGASFNGAWLQGTWFARAELQGASFEGATLYAASLRNAKLQGAWFFESRLMGASLDGAQLQGARLFRAELLAASLKATELQGASLEQIFAWRADARQVHGEGAFVVAPETQPKYSLGCFKNLCDWSADDWADLKRLIELEVPKGDGRDLALKSIMRLDPAKPLGGEKEMAESWANLMRSSPSLDLYEINLSQQLRNIGCAAASAPYVIRGFLRNLDRRFGRSSPQLAAIASAFLDEARCPGARGLSEEDKGKLTDIRRRIVPDPQPSTPR